MQLPTLQSPALKSFGLHSGRNTVHITLFSDNLTLTHQASYHIKKSRQNYNSAYVNLRKLLDSKLEEETYCRDWDEVRSDYCWRHLITYLTLVNTTSDIYQKCLTFGRFKLIFLVRIPINISFPRQNSPSKHILGYYLELYIFIPHPSQYISCSNFIHFIIKFEFRRVSLLPHESRNFIRTIIFIVVPWILKIH